jgi:hypothetical protein
MQGFLYQKGEIKMAEKRTCKNCGQVHNHCPFTDCYSEKTDRLLPDSLQDYYNAKFGEPSYNYCEEDIK